MGMFGRTLGRHESGHASMPKGGATVTIPATAPKTPARRGAFGRGWLTPERLQVIGATLQQLDGQQGAIEGALSNIDERSVAERQRQEDDQQRKALQAALQTIDDPQLRAFASIDPRGYASSQMPMSREDQMMMDLRRQQLEQDQRQFEQSQATTRRGQDLDYSAAQARVGVGRPLRGPDASLMTRARETAESQRGLRGLAQEFAGLQAQQPTGPGAGINPLTGGVWLDRETRAMDALSARMLGLMRPAGSGATSDFEQRIYARGAPSIDNTPQQNAAIIAGIERATQIADARQFFYELYADQVGSLNGAEQAFQASEDYRSLADPALLAPQSRAQAQPQNLRNANRAGPAQSRPPAGITSQEWQAMTPEERALWQN